MTPPLSESVRHGRHLTGDGQMTSGNRSERADALSRSQLRDAHQLSGPCAPSVQRTCTRLVGRECQR